MDLLRAIRNLVTRTKANEPPGIKFNKADRTLQAKLVLVGDNGAGKPSLVWSLHRKEPCLHRQQTRIEPLPFGSTNNEHYEVETDTPRGHVRIDLWDAWAHIDYDQLQTTRTAYLASKKDGWMKSTAVVLEFQALLLGARAICRQK
ncbi:hypothetical protein FRC09_015793 [Ceratobasidium sp. 395]|nr:hypothetical protein FRC09_015793 [Ceratobasidium sp. 395]